MESLVISVLCYGKSFFNIFFIKFDDNSLQMLTSIKGVYEDGKIVLDETPSVQNKSKVVVTFLEEIQPSSFQERRLGSLKGKIGIPDNFNDPLDDLKDYMY